MIERKHFTQKLNRVLYVVSTSSNVFGRRALPALLLSILLVSSAACSSFSRTIAYPAYYAPPETERALFKCKSVQNKRLWYILFGSVSLNRPSPQKLFPGKFRLYRVVEKKSNWDLALSILMGTFSSVTTSHLEFQQCDVRGIRPGTQVAPAPRPESELKGKPFSSPSTDKKPATVPKLDRSDKKRTQPTQSQPRKKPASPLKKPGPTESKPSTEKQPAP